MTPDEIIKLLDLHPHPEGGCFREVFRDASDGPRDHSTAIYYLLRAGEHSNWHRINDSEMWHFYAGEPLELTFVEPGIGIREHVLGNDFAAGQRPLIVVPKGAWQKARPLGSFTLVGCTVAPGFEFEDLEIAPPGWEPPSTAQDEGHRRRDD